MIFTIEISHYPLTDNYEEQIITFINHLKRTRDILIVTNAMSTQVKGDHTILMPVIGEAIALMKGDTSSTILKIIPRDLPIEQGHLSI